MTDKIKIFKGIFEGLDSAYGQTIKTDQFDERGKHKTKSYTVSQVPVPKIWEEHLKGTDPGLGIVPINKENKCKWGCIDIDTYPFDHKNFLNKLKSKNIPMILFRSKSGGGHACLFTNDFVPAVIMRAKLKLIASALGFAKAEIFPKQDYIRVDRGDTGSFLNLPYHGGDRTMRFAYDEKGEALKIDDFFEAYKEKALSLEELKNLKIANDKNGDEFFKGMPPCLVTLLSDGVPNGQRNNCMYNVGVYLKKRYSEKDEWQSHMFTYNKKFMEPPLDVGEINEGLWSADSSIHFYTGVIDSVVNGETLSMSMYYFADYNVQDGKQYVYSVVAYDMGLPVPVDTNWVDNGDGTFTQQLIENNTNPDGYAPAGYQYIENSRGTTEEDPNFVIITPGYRLNTGSLSSIKVVPNPYIVRSDFTETEYKKRLRFTNLPEGFKISIFTITGELVNSYKHESDLKYDANNVPVLGGNAVWDLRTVNNQEIAPGLYIYTVESGDLTPHIGKFAVIR